MPARQSPTPITSFAQIRPQWRELLGRAVVNNLYITPVWQELWWRAFQDGRTLAGFYLTNGDGDLTRHCVPVPLRGRLCAGGQQRHL